MTQRNELPAGSGSSTLVENLVDRMINSVDDADARAAVERVDRLRVQLPDADADALVDALIRRKAVQAGMVGAATAGAAFIPGVGTLTSVVLGTAADMSVSLRLQTELVLEIAAARGHEFSSDEWRNTVMIVTGVSVGAEQLFTEASKRLASKATRRFAGRGFIKAIPVIGVVGSAAANMLSTYIIGKRANAYFSLGPEAVESPAEILRALSGMDERTLAGWLGESLQAAGTLFATGAAAVGQQAANLGGAGLDAVARRLPRRRKEG